MDTKMWERGEQEIVRIEENRRIDFELRFIEPFDVIADFHITGNETTRGWGVKFPEIRIIDIEAIE
ncbi:SRPBCC family protein [Rhodohalobacter halophilus]|uniref:hypothetical protein n=1 Tax=Rhodohalobacter halophilus TaxID=1812810 RepID=UPI00114CAFD1|nr:hypothetical protein [Rhodohalobacter halophilus]